MPPGKAYTLLTDHLITGLPLRSVPSVRNKQLPTCPPRVEIAGGKLIDLEGCPLDNLKFQKNNFVQAVLLIKTFFFIS